MREQGNFVYNEEVLHAVDARVAKLREIMLVNAVANAGGDPSCIREDGKVVVKPKHLMTDKDLAFYLNTIGLK
jgi:hypothetical protein